MPSEKKEKARRSSRLNNNKKTKLEKHERCCGDKKLPNSAPNDSERSGCSPQEAKESHNKRAELCCAIPAEKAEAKECSTIYALMSKVRF